MSIKLRRARKLSAYGTNNATFEINLAKIPTEVASALTGAQIALMVDAMRAAHLSSVAFSERGIVASEMVWDARKETFRSVAVTG
jgi:hypothetical protein